MVLLWGTVLSKLELMKLHLHLIPRRLSLMVVTLCRGDIFQAGGNIVRLNVSTTTNADVMHSHH